MADNNNDPKPPERAPKPLSKQTKQLFLKNKQERYHLKKAVGQNGLAVKPLKRVSSKNKYKRAVSAKKKVYS
jgi:hypothetical protein